VEAGKALTEILAKKLYRHLGTFEQYVKAPWKIGYRRAAQLMEVAKAADNLNNCSGDVLHESQIRPLVGLDPDQQREAWKLATAGSENPTAAQVEQAVRAFKDKDCLRAQRHTIKLFEVSAEMSLLEKLSDLGFNYVSEVYKAFEERAATSEERDEALLFLFNDFERITESIRAHFALNPETDRDATEPVSSKKQANV
jgi:hypothetical protein